MGKQHTYNANLTWTGNTGQGTETYRSYQRSYSISINNKITIEGSSDPAFMGNPSLHNPEEMLLMSLSSCHMLWFLHLCSEAGVVVTAYTDNASAIMVEESNGSGRFTEVVLHPHVVVMHQDMMLQIDDLHKKANQYCFIANSVNFPVKHVSTSEVHQQD
ncbi:OsmC family protein [Mucilaginibacter galii]|uniref:Peroxiredoxin n=1 Tax=Mucilaginibacter galii TaxID=2005073 RepID=A0A917JB08_9SPHI|nr:OsmC family protein [Mucilaginibacter galii]GGI51916.1 peroxiredoxin [Mucilaginibacter galii]